MKSLILNKIIAHLEEDKCKTLYYLKDVSTGDEAGDEAWEVVVRPTEKKRQRSYREIFTKTIFPLWGLQTALEKEITKNFLAFGADVAERSCGYLLMRLQQVHDRYFSLCENMDWGTLRPARAKKDEAMSLADEIDMWVRMLVTPAFHSPDKSIGTEDVPQKLLITYTGILERLKITVEETLEEVLTLHAFANEPHDAGSDGNEVRRKEKTLTAPAQFLLLTQLFKIIANVEIRHHDEIVKFGKMEKGILFGNVLNRGASSTANLLSSHPIYNKKSPEYQASVKSVNEVFNRIGLSDWKILL